MLLGSLLVIVALFLVYSFWWNGWIGAPVFDGRWASEFVSPMNLTIKPTIVNTDQISIDLLLSSTFNEDVSNLMLQVKTTPGLRAESIPPARFDLHPNQPFHTTVQVTGAPGNKSEAVLVYASTESFGNSVLFYLEPQFGSWQIVSESAHFRRHPVQHDAFSVPGGLGLSLTPLSINGNQVSIDAQIVAEDNLDATLKVLTPPNFQVVVLPQAQFLVHANQPIHATINLNGAFTDRIEKITACLYKTGAHGGGARAWFYLEPQNGKWRFLSRDEFSMRFFPYDDIYECVPDLSP